MPRRRAEVGQQQNEIPKFKTKTVSNHHKHAGPSALSPNQAVQIPTLNSSRVYIPCMLNRTPNMYTHSRPLTNIKEEPYTHSPNDSNINPV